jgi:hypothetical protein
VYSPTPRRAQRSAERITRAHPTGRPSRSATSNGSPSPIHARTSVSATGSVSNVAARAAMPLRASRVISASVPVPLAIARFAGGSIRG